jgi:hypothetical protein
LTLKLVELVAIPPGVVTLIRPVVAPLGTFVVIRVSDDTVNVADVPPPNVTLVAPVKAVPLIVTAVPALPLVGLNDVIRGAGTDDVVTVKADALVALPPGAVTLIGPLVAPLGTVAVICASESTVNVAAVPLNATDVAPVNPPPLNVTDVPLAPLVGVNELIDGADIVEPHDGKRNEPMRVFQLSPVVPRSVVGCVS